MQSEANTPVPTAGAVGKRSRRIAWWKKIFRPAAAMAGLIVAGAEVKAAPVADSGEYRSATAVPDTWQAFARQLQQRFEQQLAGDSDGARRIQDYLTRHDKKADAPALKIALRAWVLADGRVDRIEVDGIDDAMMRIELRALLMDGSVGAPPPAMLQPVHLRLSLRAKDRTRDGH